MRVLLLALALAGASGLAHAQGYPSRPITLIIPTAVGGGNDTLGRVVADRMSPILGQQIVPENRGGAGGTLATKQLANSPPDGYTLGISNSGTMGMGPSMYPNAGYDPRKDFAPIGGIAASAVDAGGRQGCAGALRCGADRTRQERAGQAHLWNRRRRQSGPSGRRAVRQHGRHQADPRAVPRPGSRHERPPRRSHHHDLRRRLDGHGQHPGRHDPAAWPPPARRATRISPDLPTVAEAGLTGYSAEQRYGMLAPAGTPAPIVQKLNAALRDALNSEQVKAQIANEGAVPIPGAPEDYARDIDREETKWAKVIRESGALPK